ncbi:hypothetical protein [Pseudomonas rubra]|uniref:Uncharacterized protein n=1 Tax=Pseudomonas rubra TaxID=2942627 RepID=A0ABT5P8M3_9PSED|nr:hypothetical protein [Pseudomonas rubra]MDD1014645.1 hypothetical protein [Pseudomonas rubra]MDD1041376.1 hypothetical protein [Pseudomonas rubra]MDD1155799.1 hypothetical protein [Pseudomonas rubra]
MEAKAFARTLKASINEVKSQGHESIHCDNLVNHIDALVEATSQNGNSISQSGQNAIKTMLLLNGGAAIALLAFIGKLSDNNSGAIVDFAYSLTAFVIGALAIGISACMTYLAQIAFDSNVTWHNKVGTTLQLSCIALGLASILLFAFGTYATYQALLCLATCA